jgi:hypothetical protein
MRTGWGNRSSVTFVNNKSCMTSPWIEP